MNNIPMPDVSPAFTMEDIHKIREWNQERRKGMSKQELIDDINRGASEFEAIVETARQAQRGAAVV